MKEEREWRRGIEEGHGEDAEEGYEDEARKVLTGVGRVL